jgi:hypothetical protein
MGGCSSGCPTRFTGVDQHTRPAGDCDRYVRGRVCKESTHDRRSLPSDARVPRTPRRRVLHLAGPGRVRPRRWQCFRPGKANYTHTDLFWFAWCPPCVCGPNVIEVTHGSAAATVEGLLRQSQSRASSFVAQLSKMLQPKHVLAQRLDDLEGQP